MQPSTLGSARASLLALAVTMAAGSSAVSQQGGSQPGNVGKPRIEYCDADAHLAMANIHAPITFRNHRRDLLILSRRFGQPQNVKVVDHSGVVAYKPDFHIYETEDVALGPEPDGRTFEMIKPGDFAERDFVLGVPVSKDPAHPVKGTLLPGAYRLSAERSTWPFYADGARARQMQRWWRPTGTLVISPVKLSDLRLDILLPAAMPACASEH